MKSKIQLSNFQFRFVGYGHYEVTYFSPNTRKHWTTRTNNMPLIDATKNEDNPKKKDLNRLKDLCKGR
jgi:hypothetical protein